MWHGADQLGAYAIGPTKGPPSRRDISPASRPVHQLLGRLGRRLLPGKLLEHSVHRRLGNVIRVVRNYLVGQTEDDLKNLLLRVAGVEKLAAIIGSKKNAT